MNPAIYRHATLAFLLALFSACQTAPPKDAAFKNIITKDGLTLRMKFDDAMRNYTLIVTNSSNHSIGVIDTVSRNSIYRHYSGPAFVMVQDSNRNLITNSDSQDGWWTELIMQSQGFEIPNGFRRLLPGDSFGGTFPIQATMYKLIQPKFEDWKQNKRFKMRFMIDYGDWSHGHNWNTVLLETDWMELKNVHADPKSGY